MSSSGLIYAVIVGAWAAYLVPMWLRRQDELNEARPTERFSTAIRLLSGRAAMERRYAKELRERTAEEAGPEVDPDRETDRMESVDVRAFAAPPAHTEARLGDPARAPERAPGHQASDRPAHDRLPHQAPDRRHQERPGHERRSGERPGEHVPPARRRPRSGAADAERARRAQRSQVLARRRRTTIVLFLAFTLGAIVAAVGGLGFLWAPAVPAVLLSTYIVHLRAQERRRFAFTMDRRRAEDAAQRLRENRPRRNQPAASDSAEPDDDSEAHHAEPEPTPTVSPRRPAAARWSSRRTTRSGWTSSANATVSRATAGSPFPYRCPPMSPRPSPPGHGRGGGRRPGDLERGPLQHRRAHPDGHIAPDGPRGRPGPAPAHEPVPPQPRPGPDPALRPVRRRGPAACGQ